VPGGVDRWSAGEPGEQIGSVRLETGRVHLERASVVTAAGQDRRRFPRPLYPAAAALRSLVARRRAGLFQQGVRHLRAAAATRARSKALNEKHRSFGRLLIGYPIACFHIAQADKQL